MIIENVEALKKWLMDTVAPICDADPEPLSRYCLALVKKDKPESELREFCLDQLEVFLQGKTPAFVDVLFDALKSKSYLGTSKGNQESDTTQEKPSSTTDDIKIKEEPKEVDSTVSDSKTEPHVRRSKSKDDQKDLRDVIRRRHGSRSPSPRRRDREYEERRRRYDDRRVRRRSRSRSPYRSGRGRSPPPRGWSPRDRSPRGRSRSPRNWSPRGRSPQRLRSRSPRGRTPPRRVQSRDSPRRWSRSPRSWSPRGRSPGYRSPKGRPRSPRRSFSWSRSKSRSISRSRSRSRSADRKKDSRGPTPTMDNGKYKETTIPTTGITVYSTAHKESSNEAKVTTVSSRPRCKDYDEQGFCMRGDLCPYDHGSDPVIVEDVSIPSYPPPSGPPPSSRPPPMPPHGPPPPMMPRPPPPRPERFEPYNPEAPAINRPPPFWNQPPGPPPPMSGPPPGPPGMYMMHGPPLPPNMQQQRQRDLVNIQTVPEERTEEPLHPPGTEPPPPAIGQPERVVIAPKRPYDNSQDRQYGQPPQKKPFDFNRIGGYRKPGGPVVNNNTSLEVRKIPRDMNNISKLNEYFGKFGTITNLQVMFEGDPEAALVTFATNPQAFAAYKSSEPLFNNRFIKVFFHKAKDGKKEQGEESSTTQSAPTSTTPTPPPPKQADQRNVKLRTEIPPAHKLSLNNTVSKQSEAPKPEKTIVYTPSLGVITKTVYNTKAPAVPKPKLTSPTAVGSAQFVSKIEAIKKKEDIKKEAAKKKAEIQKQKQDLLEKQIEQQKKLIEKLEKNKNLSTEDKDKIKQTLKILTNSIEKLTKEVIPVVQKVTPPATPELPLPVITSPEQAKKEILDAELELFNKQQIGEDTIALRKKLNELTKQASSMGLLGRGRGRGMRGGRGRGFIPGRGSMTWVAGGAAVRGRGTSHFPVPKSRSLDNRPKQIEVSGFKTEQKDQLEAHFKQFGMVDRLDFDDVDNSAIVTFKTRQDAENAVLRGTKLQDSLLTMKWHTGVKINIRLNVSSDDSFTGEHNESAEGETADDIDEEALLADEEALLGGEDEEEDDEESRSWRR